MTSSFHETKTWDRTCKHHYNDILTNMPTKSSINHPREEGNTMQTALFTAVCSSKAQRLRSITVRTPATTGTD